MVLVLKRPLVTETIGDVGWTINDAREGDVGAAATSNCQSFDRFEPAILASLSSLLRQ